MTNITFGFCNWDIAGIVAIVVVAAVFVVSIVLNNKKKNELTK